MPLTDIADFMIWFEAQLEDAGKPAEAPNDQAGIDALNAPPRTFQDVYGALGRSFAQMIETAEQSGDPCLAQLLRVIDAGIEEGIFDIPSAAEPAPRLTPFVYPVV